MTINKPTRNEFLWLGAFILLIIVLWYIFRPIPVIKNDSLEQYLKEQNDSLLQVIKQRQYDSIELSNRKIDTLIDLVKNNDWKIIKTKEYYETIVHDLDNVTDSALQRFFNDRYSPGK